MEIGYDDDGHPIVKITINGVSSNKTSTKIVSMQDVQKAYYSSNRVKNDIQCYRFYLDVTLKDLSIALRDNCEEDIAVAYSNLHDIRAALMKREYFNMGVANAD